jgi:3-oxoacyl-[acyl-carrier-protein] synthase II
MVAARQALLDAGLDPTSWDGARVGVVIGTAMGGVASMETGYDALRDRGAGRIPALTLPGGLVNMTAGLIAMEFAALGPNLSVSTACASGATAIGVARDMIRSGAADVVIAGGVESAITPFVVSSFARIRALSTAPRAAEQRSRPFDADRDGFVLAEGAAILVLEESVRAQERGARTRAHLVGYGASADAFHVTAPHPRGEGAQRALDAALAEAKLEPGQIDYVNAHGTSTPANDVSESRLIARVLGTDVCVSSTKGVTGHMIGAAGAAEAAFCVLAVQHGWAPPTANLQLPGVDIGINLNQQAVRLVGSGPAGTRTAVSNSFGFGGQNAVLAFSGTG